LTIMELEVGEMTGTAGFQIEETSLAGFLDNKTDVLFKGLDSASWTKSGKRSSTMFRLLFPNLFPFRTYR